ncbi:ribulose-phosphate 3-epimerase [Bacteroidota bacterium]
MTVDNLLKEIKSKAPILSVCINDCDLLNIADQLKSIEKAGAEILHFAVKDGCFVPELTFGPCLIKAINTPLLKDVHLMIHDPAEKIDDYLKSGADFLTIHIESDYCLQDTLKRLNDFKSFNDPSRSVIRGIAMNPDIPLEDLAPFLEDLELVSIMSYNPKVKRGKIDDKLQHRIKTMKKMIEYAKKDILLVMNGGVDNNNIKMYAELGVDIFVIGKPIFENDLITDNIIALKSILEN